MTEAEILARLVAFRTVTGGPNLDLIDWVEGILTEAGFAVTRVPSSCGTKAGLLARKGHGPGGLLLSAHSDVVPVEGQAWTTDPFSLTPRGDRLVGRGATDMKGFLACVLARALQLDAPNHPMMIALSWDEEIGCRGIAEMIDQVIPTLGRPDLVIVGEPTQMRLCTGHKGKAAYRAICHGEPGHSSMAPLFSNALHHGADLIQVLRQTQTRVSKTGPREDGYDVPYSTLHAGRMTGGVALNMMPERAEIEFEIRHVTADTPADLLAEVMADLPDAITIEEVTAYPGLSADPHDPAITALARHLDQPTPIQVSYGTEAGFFYNLGLPTVVCGPGSMADGHQPDEAIDIAQLDRCARLLRDLTQ